MSEEKKINELEELGVSIVENPSSTIERSNPTKLKLTTVTFMAIAKIQLYFLNKMLEQAQSAKDLAVKGLESVSMPKERKENFISEFDNDINILAGEIKEFKEKYERLFAHGKRSLKVPERNGVRLLKKGRTKKEMTGVVDSHREMNNIFASTKDKFASVAKPVEREVEISNVEQDNIRKAVYNALNGVDESKINRNNYGEAATTISENAMRELGKTDVKTRDKKAEGIFDNGEKRTALNKEAFEKILHNGRVNSEEKIDSNNNGKSVSIEDENNQKPVVTPATFRVASPAPMLREEKSIFDTDNIFSKDIPVINASSLNHAEEVDTESEKNDYLSDAMISKLTSELVNKKASSIFEKKLDEEKEELDQAVEKAVSLANTETEENDIPDPEILKQQLEESMLERENKRKAKENAKHKYEEERKNREQKEEELSQSKKEVEAIKQDIERKRQEQKDIDKLSNDVKRALALKRQIEENRLEAAKEEEEARKYQKTLEEERKEQERVDKEKQQISEEKARLKTENSRISSDIQSEKENLESLKRELQKLSSPSVGQAEGPLEGPKVTVTRASK